MTAKITLESLDQHALSLVRGGYASAEAFPAQQHRTWGDSVRERQDRIQEGYPGSRPGYQRPYNLPGPGNNTI